MAISSPVKIVIPSVSRAAYSILSSGMQNAAAVLASNFLKHPNKYVYPLYTRLFALWPSKLQFHDYAYCYLLSKLKCQVNNPSVARVATAEGGDYPIYDLVLSNKITHFIIDWLTVSVILPAYCGPMWFKNFPSRMLLCLFDLDSVLQNSGSPQTDCFLTVKYFFSSGCATETKMSTLFWCNVKNSINSSKNGTPQKIEVRN